IFGQIASDVQAIPEKIAAASVAASASERAQARDPNGGPAATPENAGNHGGDSSNAEGAAPPESDAEIVARLMRFYSTETLEQLALAQNRHVEKLQLYGAPHFGDVAVRRV